MRVCGSIRCMHARAYSSNCARTAQSLHKITMQLGILSQHYRVAPACRSLSPWPRPVTILQLLSVISNCQRSFSTANHTQQQQQLQARASTTTWTTSCQCLTLSGLQQRRAWCCRTQRQSTGPCGCTTWCTIHAGALFHVGAYSYCVCMNTSDCMCRRVWEGVEVATI